MIDSIERLTSNTIVVDLPASPDSTMSTIFVKVAVQLYPDRKPDCVGGKLLLRYK